MSMGRAPHGQAAFRRAPRVVLRATRATCRIRHHAGGTMTAPISANPPQRECPCVRMISAGLTCRRIVLRWCVALILMLWTIAYAAALSVVVPTDCSEARLVAADDFAKTLAQMTGSEVPVIMRDADGELPEGPRVLLGDQYAPEDARADLTDERIGYDGYIIRSLGDDALLLCGRNDAGHSNAAYGWLREMGCRWLMPGPHAAVIPEADDVRLSGWDEVEKPAWVHRQLWYSALKRIMDQAPEEAAACNEELQTWLRRNRMGRGTPVQFGHNFYRVVPADQYFETHPEYFPLRDGKRTREGQVCTTNEDVIELFAEAAIAFFDEHPQMKTFSLSANDNYGWCECEDCVALDPPERRDDRHGMGDRSVVFANEVARRVRNVYPDRWLAFYAYAGNVKPPLHADPDENVLVVLAHYVADHLRAINDPRSKWNAAFMEYVDGWGAVAEQMFLREYYCRWWAPWPMYPAVAADIPYLTSRNFNGFNAELEYRAEGAEIGWYLLGQLCWDPTQDADALLAEYFEGLYGPAASEMRSYFEILREAADNPDLRARAAIDEIPDIFPPERIERARAQLERAMPAADTQQQRFQVQRSVDAMEMMGAFYDLQAAIRAAADGLDDAERAEVAAQYERMEAVLERIREYDLARYWSTQRDGGPASLMEDARLLLGLEQVDPWTGDFREDSFGRQILAFSRMVESEGIRWSDSVDNGYIYGNDSRAAWYIAADEPIERATVSAFTYDNDEGAGWLEWQVSFDRGQTWETVARVDNDGWKRAEVDLTEWVAGREEFVLGVHFARGANTRARLSSVAVEVQ
ncbi:MAG: DUF4838 domain-containing protein [Armatimonadia bacterium]|nr:DUF4838 domain-containing protein [Armatimonadia bacterium]